MASKSPRNFVLNEFSEESWDELLLVAIQQCLAATQDDQLMVDVLIPTKAFEDDFEQFPGSSVLRRC